MNFWNSSSTENRRSILQGLSEQVRKSATEILSWNNIRKHLHNVKLKVSL